jgi:hypothetical protein
MASIINASSTGSGGIVQTADASGVLQLQTNGTTAVTVAASANVGIGEASPTSKLIVNSGANTTVAGFNSTGSSAFIGMANSGATTFIGNDSTSGSFVVQTPGSSFATKLTISPAGYVTTPYQPAFSQIGAASFTVNTTGDLVFTSSNVWASSASTLLNTGSNFNVANGRFTAPVSGNYLFIVSVACAFTSGYFYLYFFKNGAAIANANRNFSQNSQAVTQSLQMIIPLVAGDYITCATNNNSTGFSLYAPWFCGYLMS